MVLATPAARRYGAAVVAIYPILDVDACERHAIAPDLVARTWIDLGVKRMQVRAKSWSADATLDLLRQVRPITRAAGCLLFANDRVDLALLAQCDGVHVGQEDLPVTVVRRTAPELRVGVSTHSLAELERALQDKPDYVAFGPVFTTLSKANAEPEVGPERLAQAHGLCRAAGVALVAIGGIEAEHARDIVADEVALIGALMGSSPEQVRQRTQYVQAAFRAG